MKRPPPPPPISSKIFTHNIPKFPRLQNFICQLGGQNSSPWCSQASTMSLLRTAFPDILDLMVDDTPPSPDTTTDRQGDRPTTTDEEERGPRQRGPPIERRVVVEPENTQTTPRAQQGPQGNSHREKQCYCCHRMGHIRRDCPLRMGAALTRVPVVTPRVLPPARVMTPMVPRPVPLQGATPTVARRPRWNPERHAPYPPTHHLNGVWAPNNELWALQPWGQGRGVQPAQNLAQPSPPTERTSTLDQITEVLHLLVRLGERC